MSQTGSRHRRTWHLLYIPIIYYMYLYRLFQKWYIQPKQRDRQILNNWSTILMNVKRQTDLNLLGFVSQNFINLRF